MCDGLFASGPISSHIFNSAVVALRWCSDRMSGTPIGQTGTPVIKNKAITVVFVETPICENGGGFHDIYRSPHPINTFQCS